MNLSGSPIIYTSMLSDQQQKEVEFSNEMLDVFDNCNYLSHGDLQGILEAVFNKYFNQK